MKKLFAALLALASVNAFATDAFISNVNVGTLSVRGGLLLFSVTGGIPTNVCNHYGNQFNVDITTPGGKNLYVALLAAKLNNSKIELVYTTSPTPEVNPCFGENMAKPFVINIL